MGLGITASGEGYASVSTPVSAGGGIGAQNFNLGSLGIGTSGGFGTGAASVPTWVWIVGAVIVAAVVYKKVLK